MTYDRYYNLINKVARVKNFLMRHKLLLTAIICLIAGGVTFLLYSCGSFTVGVSCESAVYGEPLTFSAKAFLAPVSFEFSEKGKDTWSYDVPTMPGEYTVRASTVNIFSVERTSEADFTIGIRQASISVDDATVVYGSPSYTLRSEGLAKGDSITEVTYIADREPTDEGSVSVNTFKIVNEDGEDVSSAYEVTLSEGALVVETRPITFSVKRVSKEYDATPITPSDWYIAAGSLAEGDRAIVTFEGTQTEIGSSESVITSFKIVNAEGKDVTYCYAAETAPGTVTVERIKLTFTTGSLESEYDGTVKVCNTYEYTSDKLFGNDVLDKNTVIFSAGTLLAGEYPNKLLYAGEIKIYDSVTGENVSSRYAIVVSEGTIKINKRNITVRTDSIEREYDGKNITDRGEVTVVSGSLAATDVIAGYDTEGNIVNVGSIKNGIVISLITNQAANLNVTSCYNVTYEYGDLTVVKRKVTVKTPDLSKVYDGYPLIPEGGLVFVEGTIAEGDKLSCTLKNTITDVGSVENAFELSLSTENHNVTNVEANYELTAYAGTLTIYPREITLKSPVSVFIYTGQEFFTTNELYVYDGSLAYGQSAVVLTKSSITEVGTKENIFTADIKNASGVSLAKNYIINCEYGHLVVLPKGANGIKRIDIFGQEPPKYDIEIPDLKIPDAPPPPENEDDDNVDYIPPVPPENQGGNQGNQNPELPPDLQYPPQGENNSGENEGGNNGDDKDEEEKPLFYVFTEKKQTLFLRGTSYGDYNGEIWEAGEPYVSNYRKKNPLLYASDRLNAIPGFDAKIYELKIKGTTDFYSTYFSTSFPDRLLSDVANIADSSEYSVFFYDFEETRELLYNSNPISNREIDEYTKWVYANYLGIDPSLKAQLIDIAAQNGVHATSPTLISDVVYYLKKTAKYNLNYSEYPSDQDTIIYFLTVAKEGICIHYAGAAALLYRAYGIPARVAVGYKCESKAGEWTPIFSPAHAWVEIYIDGAWYPIEATPSGSGSNLSSFLEDPIFKNQNAYPEFRPEITVEIASVQKYYDGKALRSPEVKVTGDKLKKGHKLIARSDASITYVGWVNAKCDFLQIVDENGNDVSHEYCLRIKEGTLTVLSIAPQRVQSLLYRNSGDIFIPARQMQIDLYSGSEQKIVNVPEFLFDKVTHIAGGSVGVETVFDDPADPMAIAYKLTGNGQVTFRIALKSIDVNGDGIKEYNGGTIDTVIDVSHFSNVKFRNVSLTTALKNGSIDLSKRNVYTEYVDSEGRKFVYLAVATSSASKIFDGTPLTANSVDILSGAVLEGHSFYVENSGTRTYVGKMNNVCNTLRVVDVNGNDVTYMYAIDVFLGSLEVLPDSAEPDFTDIAIQKNEEYDLTSLGWVSLVNNYPLTVSVAEGSNYTVVENNRIVGIKQGDSVVEVVFAGVDMNFDGMLEYDRAVYKFNISVSDPNLYENMFVIILIAFITVAFAVLLVVLRIFVFKKKAEVLDGANAEETEESTFKETVTAAPPESDRE